MAEKWIQGAREEMEKNKTVGKFGKATPSKIKAGMKAGGVEKKEAVFAKNMKAIAEKHHSEKREK